MKNVYKSFESVGEFSKYLATTPIKKEFAEQKNGPVSQRVDEYRTTWSGSESYEAADTMLLYGARDLAEKLEQAGVRETRIKLQKQQPKRVIRTAVTGFAPHVPNYIAGIPTAMITVREKRVQQKVMTICYNCGIRWQISSDDIIKATANLMSAAMQIEASGTRVNMYVISSGDNGCYSDDKRQYYYASVKIKEAGQAFDTMKMAYPLIHTSMFRRHMFKYIEVAPGLSKKFVAGYGSYGNSSARIATIAKEGGQKFDRLVDYDDIKNKTPEEIINLLSEPQQFRRY